jgi:pSer/pThr/pTyr-binding forkhead associated (FHA) protein
MLAQSVTPFALSALKYGLLALLFLFIWRSMRWTVRGMNVDRTIAARGAGRGKETAASAPPPTTLVVYPPDGGRPRTFRMATSMTVGRALDCEVKLEDTYASQQHARVFGKESSWYVEDLGSTNGTFVNDQKLAAPAQVQPGDRIRIGTTVLELRR